VSDGFHEWLQDELKARRMSQRQLAQRSGVDHSSISRLLRGERVPSLQTAMRLAHGVDPSVAGDAFPPESAPNSRATARVEYALRADDELGDGDVRAIMLYYLGVRRGRPTQP
jgi:transcriptional regulator with XRE-family HTH domain